MCERLNSEREYLFTRGQRRNRRLNKLQYRMRVLEYLSFRRHLDSDFGEGLSVQLGVAKCEYLFARCRSEKRCLDNASSQALKVRIGVFQVSGPLRVGF